MNKLRLCCFTVNTTHATIIANNYIKNNMSEAKIIYINKEGEEANIHKVLSNYYTELQDKMYYSAWLNEDIIHSSREENIVFVVHGEESFINKVNKYLSYSNYMGKIINCYDVSSLIGKAEDIINSHDLYINTAGVVKKQINKRNN